MTYYEYHHVVGFEETNLLGNVYFVNHLRWQGRCRESFLRESVPDIVTDFANGLHLLTVRCDCNYLAELAAFDEVVIQMSLVDLGQTQLTLAFDYLRRRPNSSDLLAATGMQRIACMRRAAPDRSDLVPCGLPLSLRTALQPYRMPAA